MKQEHSNGSSLRKTLTGFFKMLCGLVVFSLGITLCILSGLGQTTSTGTSTALAAALHIKVGTAMDIIYAVFLLLQVCLLGRRFRISALLQMLPVLINGVILNFFRYDFAPLQLLAPETYLQRLAVFAIGMPLISLGFTVVKWADFFNFPPESLCRILSEKWGIRFGTIKIFLDFVYVLTTLIICWSAGIKPDMIREGTLIFAVGNGLLINFFTKILSNCFPPAAGEACKAES